MNDKKFCFIMCINSQSFYEESVRYIERLVVPEGYEVDVIGVTDAVSMTSGYNEAMQASDAKYKIYMHQDVFVLYPFFLQSVLEIFKSDEQIGMIGMVGTEKIAVDGILWHGYQRGNVYEGDVEQSMGGLLYDSYQYQISDGLWRVQAVDGLMLITSKDVAWREDLFTGWDFYDISQSFEMRRAGYKVVVPEQKLPWCLHDDGVTNFRKYDMYRKIYLKEYYADMDLA